MPLGELLPAALSARLLAKRFYVRADLARLCDPYLITMRSDMFERASQRPKSIGPADHEWMQ